VGDKLPGWADAATAEYLKRMPREARVELLAVKPEKRASQSAQTLKQAEAARLLDKLPAAVGWWRWMNMAAR
jgi:23S rRNA (pseudouridine1915-N3)-methyltransferase